MGIGMALTEQTLVDERTGRTINPSVVAAAGALAVLTPRRVDAESPGRRARRSSDASRSGHCEINTDQ
jgi:hypothetical protein